MYTLARKVPQNGISRLDDPTLKPQVKFRSFSQYPQSLQKESPLAIDLITEQFSAMLAMQFE